MTLLDDFKKMAEARRQALKAIEARVEEATARIEELMRRNAADQGERAVLLEDIAFLDREIAQLQEHADHPMITAPPQEPRTPTQVEVERMRDERADAEREAAKPRRRQRSKPDPIKAARKAEREREEQATRLRDTGEDTRADGTPRRYAKDPMTVHEHSDTKRPGHGQGAKRTRVSDGASGTNKRVENPSPTDLARAELVFEYLEAEGERSQHQIALFLTEYLDAKPQTAASIVSHALQILQHQRRILFTGEKRPVRRGGRKQSAVWKVRETPDEQSCAGLAPDDDARPRTTDFRGMQSNAGGFIIEEQGGKADGGRRSRGKR